MENPTNAFRQMKNEPYAEAHIRIGNYKWSCDELNLAKEK